ncbi:unnamed protein product [Protopolystoma xenopodis]|uniref:Uncharacterized protein n=1 Tax=Protopolystoma xenopodis TaxID=117903 RepID=A0A3S5ARC1_9PLAT|nr:unnamed protein product [Protopolystoma xenopodis]
MGNHAPPIPELLPTYFVIATETHATKSWYSCRLGSSVAYFAARTNCPTAALSSSAYLGDTACWAETFLSPHASKLPSTTWHRLNSG